MGTGIRAAHYRSAHWSAVAIIAFVIFAALIMGTSNRAYAMVPEVIEGSYYPANDAVGVPSALEYVRVSFKSNPNGEFKIVNGEPDYNLPENFLPITTDINEGAVGQWEKIRVVELTSNTEVQATDINGKPLVWIEDATLVIKVNKYNPYGTQVDNKTRLKPGETYQVIIPQGSLVYKNDPEPNTTRVDNNSEISWTFTVERKPTPAVFSFQPGNQTFTLKNGTSTLPNRVDFHGAGYRKSLVIEFQNSMKSNIAQNTVVISGNELSPLATPHTPVTETMLDPNSANTLVIKLPTLSPLKPNHLYTVTIGPNLEDADNVVGRYFANRQNLYTDKPNLQETNLAFVPKASAISFANSVIRFAFNSVYGYLPPHEYASYGAGNTASELANKAYNLLARINSQSSVVFFDVTQLNTALTNYLNTDIIPYTYDSSTTVNAGIAAARYPLKNDPITIKFSTFRDFYATLIDPLTATIQNINNTILAIEPPRRVAVVVPKNYIKKIETIHYVQGLMPEKQSNNLTNIDITADIDVNKVVITSNRGARVLTSKINNVFTAGYSGLEADGLTEIKVQAYDKYGQLLEERNFKLGVDGSNPVKNDYVTEDTKNLLGKTYTLYELMSDPKLFAQILELYPVKHLNELGIYLPYTP